MGRHTTPGAPAPNSRDELVGWGAFSTGLAAVLVGVAAGWVHGVTVALLGGLATTALWYVRTPRDTGTGRGRHASETPWSASDLLELKDGTDDGTGRRASTDGRRRAARRRTAGSDAAPEQGPVQGPVQGPAQILDVDGEPVAADPLEWVMGARPTTEDPRPPSGRRRSGRRTARAEADAGSILDGAGPAPAAMPDGAPAPSRRRSRRAADEADGPARRVLPVAPFEMAAVSPARTPAARTVHDPESPDALGGVDDPAVADVVDLADVPDMSGVTDTADVTATPAPADVAEFGDVAYTVDLADDGDEVAVATAAVLPQAPPPEPADPLDGPVDPSWLAAEPTVLDPAHDSLWAAPALDLTAEQPVSAAQDRPVGEPDTQFRPEFRPEFQPEFRPELQPEPVAEPHDRAREAAAIEPLWARRARRPLRPRGGPRPDGPRREPAPVPRQSPGREPAAGQDGHPDPMVVVLPEPDVPDVLMLPESDVVADGSPSAGGQPSGGLPDRPAVPASRPAPGTMSLDELLVLHTRRPRGRRAGSPQRQGDEGARRLE